MSASDAASPEAASPEEQAAGEPPRPAEPPRPGARALAIGVVVAVAGGFGLLLAAGTLGTAGVVLVALVEAALVVALHRWSPSP